jgi:DNA-binding MarR family transcriptional regulator
VSRTALSVLLTLREAPRRVSELAVLEYVAQPTMTVLVTRLAKRGWIERHRDPADGRATKIALTEAGANVIAELVTRRNALLAERLGALTKREREALWRAVPILDRLIDARP